MSHAKRVTRDNRKNPEYRAVNDVLFGVAVVICLLFGDERLRHRLRLKKALHGCHCSSDVTWVDARVWHLLLLLFLDFFFFCF